MSHYQSEGEQAWELAKQLLLVALSFIFGLFLLSQWLTGLLFRFVLNPLLDGLFDRDDGAVIFAAAALWGVIAAILFPLAGGQELASSAPDELLKAWLGATVLGVLWGVAVGVWVLGVWWAEAERQMAAGYDVVQLLDSPIDIRQPATRVSSSNGHDALALPDDDLLEELILGDRP